MFLLFAGLFVVVISRHLRMRWGAFGVLWIPNWWRRGRILTLCREQRTSSPNARVSWRN
jgi:hypothetical protein